MNPGSERLQVILRREATGQSWGFRLQGGSDFTTPLSVQSVAPGGLAERCGLKAGDAVLSLNDRPSDELEHEAAKQIILMAGSEVSLLVQRGAVKVWQPKVTPFAQLRPGELKQSGDLNGPDPYVQRTSLAADKQECKPIGTGYNRSARPFQGFGVSGAAPTPVQAPATQWSSPVPTQAPVQVPDTQWSSPAPTQAPATQWSSPASQPYAPPPAASSGYGAPTSMQNVNSGMANLHVNDKPKPKTAPVVLVTNDDEVENISPSLQVIREIEQGRPAPQKRPVSPMYAALMRTVEDDSNGHESQGFLNIAEQPPRSVSPTMLAVQEEERKLHSNHKQTVAKQPSPVTETLPPGSPLDPRQDEDRYHGEENHYHGFAEPQSKQSRSFKMLQAEVDDGSTAAAPALPTGIRSVRAPVTKAPSEPKQDAQYMTCKVCGSLCVGVFVRVKGEPMHPECYKCVACGLSLKNQGFYTIQSQLYCTGCAQNAAQQQPDGQGTTVYR